MDLEHYRVVCLVGRLQSIAAAARALNMDPSKISRTVTAMEEHLRIRLFQRTTRQLTSTEEGAAYLARIEPLIEEFDAAREDAPGTANPPAGKLRMTASVAFAQECIVPQLPDFQRHFPNIALELISSDVNLDLLADRIDLAIRLAPAPDGTYVCSRLMRTRYQVCVAPSYIAQAGEIATPHDLSQHDCLLFALPQFQNVWHFRSPNGTDIDVPIRGRTVISNALSLRSAAIAGMGPCLLPDWLTRRAVSSGDLTVLFRSFICTATTFDTGAWFLYPSRQFLPRKVRSAIDFFRERLTGPRN